MAEQATVPPDTEVLGPEVGVALRPEEQYTPLLMDEAFIDSFEKGVEQYKRWLSACLRATQPQHWINHGRADKPTFQLQGPGAEALMGPLGISYTDPPHPVRENHTDETGTWYAIKIEGWLESKFLKWRGYYFAAATSRDKFFNARPGWKAETGEADVVNKAVTHWLATGVARLAGLRNPSPELLKAAGIALDKIPLADYSGTRSLEQAEGMISEAQSKRAYAISRSQNVPETTFKQKLVSIGAVDQVGKPSTLCIKRKDYDRLIAWLEAGGQDAPREPGEE